MSTPDPLRIFVAIPGTMPPDEKIYVYRNSGQVKENLLEPARVKLKKKLKRDVEVIIEKDKISSGAIHDSMFSEAFKADVYIADLSGANPNVYLELGVRWAWRESITILITQNGEDTKFNVQNARHIIYKASEINKAIDEIVATIENGLKSNSCDSPVLLNGKLITIPKTEFENLKTENGQLKELVGEKLVRDAMTKEKLDDKILYLLQALEKNPASVTALLEIGKAYRSKSMYEESITCLKRAIDIQPDKPELHRELGVTYSKQKKPDLAVAALREAVRLDPRDKEALNNLGGALRRMGMAKAPGDYDRRALEESCDSYSKAHKIDRFDLYSGLNVARLKILLSRWDPPLLEEAKEVFRKKYHLCYYEVDENPNNFWLLFDLADVLLFSENNEEYKTKFHEAVILIPPDEQKDILNTVLGPFRDYLTAGVLTAPLKTHVEEIVKQLSNDGMKN
ncbi:MAG: tetratricopeptide repeat protein [Ginsengibacter sp.]